MPLSNADKKRLEEKLRQIDQDTSMSLGYPCNFNYNYQELFPFLDYSLNNIGDPYVSPSYKINSLEFEREVLQFFAGLTRAPKDNWWGYVTNGSTEGNLYGLYLARELYPEGIVYFSQHTHYSVSKNLHFLNMRHIMIRSQDNGEIDYDDLRETIKIRRDCPPIIFANIGTTMTEAKDDLSRIREIMEDLAMENWYIHSDAALCGAYAAFLEPRPAWDFADGADSLSISGHKFIGSPIPSGIVLAKRRNVERIAHSVAYIGSMDTTISGSRNGFTPLMLWHAVRTLGREGLKQRLAHSLVIARYAVEAFNKAGIPAWRNPNAITVVLPEPSREVRDKWQLASTNGFSHIMCMPHLTESVVDDLVSDITQTEDRQVCES